LARKKRLASAVGELYVPSVLFLFYGVAGFAIYFFDRYDRFEYAGVYFSDWSILWAFFVASVAILTIMFLVRLGLQKLRGIDLGSNEKKHERLLGTLLVVLLVLDSVARVKMISAGEYFSWLRAALLVRGDLIAASPVSMLQSKFELVLFSLIAYKAIGSRKWFYVLVVLFFMVLLKGQRATLFQGVIVTSLTYLSFSKGSVDFGKLAKYGFISLVAFSVLSSIIVDVRGQFRENMNEAIANPAQAVKSIAVEYFPNAILGGSQHEKDVSKVEIGQRLTLWSGSFSSEISRLHSGKGYMPLEYFLEAITLPIPSVIYPGDKPVVEQGPRTARWYGLGANSQKSVEMYDGGSTSFSDIHKYGGLASVFVLSALYSFLLLAVAWFCICRYRQVGVVLFFAFALILDVRANNFAQILVTFRDVILMLFFVEILYFMSRVKISGNRL
jgi:hypothetical protein